MKRRGKTKVGDSWYEWFVVDDMGDIPAAAFDGRVVIVPSKGSETRNEQFARAVAISLHIWKMTDTYIFPLD